MRRGLVAFFALSLVGAGLTGCGLFRFEQREPWRAQAEEACLAQRLVQPSAYMALSSKIDGPGVCGMDHPFKVAAFTNGSIGLKSKVTLACPIIPRIDTWLDEIVKPAAMMYFGVPVVDVKAGSYSCRPRNNQRGAKVSEHAFGNAIDVMAFIFADGREVTVVKGWKGDPRRAGIPAGGFRRGLPLLHDCPRTGLRFVPLRPPAPRSRTAQSARRPARVPTDPQIRTADRSDPSPSRRCPSGAVGRPCPHRYGRRGPLVATHSERGRHDSVRG